MNLEKLLNNKLCKGIALAGLSLLSFTNAQAQTNVTVDASATWVGGMLVYDNTPQQPYLWYSDWGIDDIKTVRNTTDNTLILYPNYNVYGTGDDPTYWANGEMGNKIMQGMSLVINDALVGQQFTFSGNVLSNTLVSGYTATAFVKALDASWGLINETTAVLDPGNFTISYNAAQYPGAAHIQYGFSIKGLNGNPAAMEANGNVVVGADEPEVTNPGGDSVDVPVDANATWLGAMLVYENTPEQPYLWYSDWGIDDIKTVRNTEANTVTLYPNYNVYGTGDDPTYWTNGDQGNKIMLAISYILDDTLLNQKVNFNGNVSSYTLASGYTAKAFVKVLDAGYGLINEQTTDLTTTGDFAVNYDATAFPNAAHLQYGFMVRGLNANPAFMAQNGNVVIGQQAASVQDFNKKAISVYPNPATDVLNVASQNDAISTIQVYNLIGQQVINVTPNTTLATVNVSALKAGVYMVNTTVNGKTSTSKFIKQ
ncbi:T9SS type A sorting domain-containing protein [Flavobacterium sp. RHBU_24]|uniref:T9SS type A sorting domain-containing protein n=1 Tax=Flavobacterium sp. RHBU_24 TaxID=3391185 RepID=UPI003984B38C